MEVTPLQHGVFVRIVVHLVVRCEPTADVAHPLDVVGQANDVVGGSFWKPDIVDLGPFFHLLCCRVQRFVGVEDASELDVA